MSSASGIVSSPEPEAIAHDTPEFEVQLLAVAPQLEASNAASAALSTHLTMVLRKTVVCQTYNILAF